MASTQNYELVLIFSELDATALEKAREGVKASFEKRKATVTEAKELGNRPLFHEKNHLKRANFNTWKFNAPSENVKQLTNDLNVNSDVLKSMIVKAG